MKIVTAMIVSALAFAISGTAQAQQKTGYQIPGPTFYELSIKAGGKNAHFQNPRDTRHSKRLWNHFEKEGGSGGSGGGQ